MKRTLDETQFTELRKLGYMKDDSLAGLIEFLIERKGLYVDNIGLAHIAWEVNNEELIDWEYEIVKGVLEAKKLES